MFILCVGIFVFILGSVNGSDEKFLCTKRFCEDYIQENGCPSIDLACRAQNETYNGRLFPSPTVCNCCKICIAHLSRYYGSCACRKVYIVTEFIENFSARRVLYGWESRKPTSNENVRTWSLLCC